MTPKYKKITVELPIPKSTKHKVGKNTYKVNLRQEGSFGTEEIIKFLNENIELDEIVFYTDPYDNTIGIFGRTF